MLQSPMMNGKRKSSSSDMQLTRYFYSKRACWSLVLYKFFERAAFYGFQCCAFFSLQEKTIFPTDMMEHSLASAWYLLITLGLFVAAFMAGQTRVCSFSDCDMQTDT